MQENRDQFTFYRSFYNALQDIPSRQRRLEMYEIVCAYALDNRQPDMEKLTPIQRTTLRLMTPVLDAARKKASAGRQGGSKKKADKKQGESKIEVEIEVEKEVEVEIENEIEIETETEIEDEGLLRRRFQSFWEQYPRKVGQEKAWEAFREAEAPYPVILEGLKRHLGCPQWTESGGRYVPYPATWLSQRRWEDTPPRDAGKEVKASGRLGQAEIACLQRMMKEEG